MDEFCPMATIQSITPTACGVHTSGFYRIMLVMASDIYTMPKPVSGVVADAIVLVPGVDWAVWRFDAQTCAFMESDRLDKPGPIYTQKLTCEVRHDDPDTLAVLDGLRGVELVVIAQDIEGRRRIIGTPLAPARLSAPCEVAARGDGFSGYRFSFDAVSSWRAPFYDALGVGYYPFAFQITPAGRLLADDTYTPLTTVTVDSNGHLIVDNYYDTRYSLNSANGHAYFT